MPDNRKENQYSQKLEILEECADVFPLSKINIQNNIASYQTAATSLQQVFDLQLPALQNMATQMNHLTKIFDFSSLFKQLDQFQNNFNHVREVAHFINKPTIFSAPIVIPAQEPSSVVLIHPDQEDRIALKAATLVSARIEQLPTSKAKRSHVERLVELPTEASWENVTIVFENEHEVTIYYKDKRLGRFDNVQLSFEKKNTKNGAPTKSWQLLITFSLYSIKGTDAVPVVEDLTNGSFFKSQSSVHTAKSDLTKRLMSVFGISESPFCPYEEYCGYKPKFNLQPSPELRKAMFLQSNNRDFRDESYQDEYSL